MPKTKVIESVLHDWVHTLTFQQQALLMTAMRGPDGAQKHCTAKIIVRYLRGHVLKPAGDWKGKNDNDFMWGELDVFHGYIRHFWDNHDDYPHHFIMHLLHAAEVVGYKHPDATVGYYWNMFYVMGCRSFHLRPETEKDMDARLNDFGCGFNEQKTEP